MPRINLDELARELDWRGKRADELILAKNAIVIIERTGEPSPDDLKKLEETVRMLLEGGLDYLRRTEHGDYMQRYYGDSKPRVIAVVCKRKGASSKFRALYHKLKTDKMRKRKRKREESGICSSKPQQRTLQLMKAIWKTC